MKKHNVMLLLLLLNMGRSFAQLNESDTAKIQLRASLTGNHQQGNVEVLTVKGKLDFIFSPESDWVFKSQNSNLYQSFYSKKADNDIFSRNYLYYQPQNKVYPFAIAYISGNFRRKIDTRYFAGAGVTWQSVNAKNHVLKLSVSIVYEATRFRGSLYNYEFYNGDDRIKLWRGTLYLGGWSYLLQRHLRLYYDAYWQPAFNNENNYRTQLDIGADLPVWKGLAFNILYAYTHENVVLKTIKQDDRILTFGMTYNFRQTGK